MMLSAFRLFALLSFISAGYPLVKAYNILVIGGTRFSGAALWKELHERGHQVTLFNRGKTTPTQLTRESPSAFESRLAKATFLKGDRKNADDLRSLIDPSLYDYVYDMNAREEADVIPLAELFIGVPRLKQYVFMSSAGVYLKSNEMPHLEKDPVDPKSRHSGKLDSERFLDLIGIPFCSFRPTYICGPQNYNPVERYFFSRIDAGRPICIPGHGQHITGLGHVEDLARAMANVVDRHERTNRKRYNVQNSQSVTFDGIAEIAAKIMGKSVEIVHYEAKDFKFPSGKKAFPMRPQHFFTGIHQAVTDLDWSPEFDSTEAILKDAYESDFLKLKAGGELTTDFTCDDIILQAARVPA